MILKFLRFVNNKTINIQLFLIPLTSEQKFNYSYFFFSQNLHICLALRLQSYLIRMKDLKSRQIKFQKLNYLEN